MNNGKEFLYVGCYLDENDDFILKVGTTNNLERRKAEHTRNYRKADKHKLIGKREFVYLWHLPLSKYNTLRFEDKTRQRWQDEKIGEYVRNDRFVCKQIPERVEVTIRKTYTIEIPKF